MRVPQPAGTKGSLKWIQEMVAQSPSPLETAIRAELALPGEVVIEWRSPLKSDERAEYRDGDFLDKVGRRSLRNDLSDFWPSKGPQWDALGVTSDEKILLVEAKGHTSEMISSCGAGEKSRKLIDRTFATVKAHYGAQREADWTARYYQYANRLAHLHFLRERGIDAHLFFIYFLNDRDVRGPSSALGWADALEQCYTSLGLAKDRSIEGLHSIFVDVT